MNDQAQVLRDLIQNRYAISPTAKPARIIAVTSGKGGVGKSNFTLNFALSLQAKGLKVLVFDADIGLANIDVLMGITPKYNLYHLLKKQKTIWDIIHRGYNGMEFIAGGSGFHDMVRLSDEQLDYFAKQISQLHYYCDIILFDTGAGLSKETTKFILAAEETIVVTTPEPTSITDAYAIIKMVNQMQLGVSFKLVINRITETSEGRHTADKITMAAKKFLDINDIPIVGYIEDDAHISRAVKRQVPFTIAYPNCAASRNMKQIADQFVQRTSNEYSGQSTGVKGFLSRMFKLMS